MAQKSTEAAVMASHKNSSDILRWNHKKAFRFHKQIFSPKFAFFPEPPLLSAEINALSENRGENEIFICSTETRLSKKILQKINHQQSSTQLHFRLIENVFPLDYSSSMLSFWCSLYISNTKAANS